jgi:hypothetical protein
MTYLIPDDELAAMAARVLAKATSPPPPSPPAPKFEYRPRTQAQWQKRIDQNPWSNRHFRPKPEPARPPVEPDLIDDPEIDDRDNEDSGETPKGKVSSTTPCLCGHPRKDHHVTPEPHTVDGENAYYCVLPHCAVFSYRDGVSAPCDCPYFRVNETDAPKFTRPRVGPYDLCANCGHFKHSHCIAKKKPLTVARFNAGESGTRTLRKANGDGYGCKHTSLTDCFAVCTSSSCSATDDGEEYCKCEKFVNPWLVRKTRVASGKKRATVSQDASPAVALTDGTSETAPAKPRRSRKKKTAFVTGTGELFPPASVNP